VAPGAPFRYTAKRMDRHRAIVVARVALLAPAAGCFLSTDTTNTTTTSPTLLTVDPSSFLGPVRCAEGELRLYSVTLTDVTPPLPGFEPPIPFPVTSGLVPCNEPVMFAGGRQLIDAGRPLEIGHYYVARIDGYDTDDIELVVLDAGVTTARRISTKEPVLPRWTTTCGEPLSVAADDAGQDAQRHADVDGGSISSPNPFRRPTLIVDSIGIRLQGCLPFGRPAAPESPDAGADGETAVDASADGGH
jgi:hypothetical protein